MAWGRIRAGDAEFQHSFVRLPPGRTRRTVPGGSELTELRRRELRMSVLAENLFDVRGMRVLVTGASRGNRRAVALGFAQNGADVFAVARTEAALDETPVTAKASGLRCDHLAVDLTGDESACCTRPSPAHSCPHCSSGSSACARRTPSWRWSRPEATYTTRCCPCRHLRNSQP